MNKRYIEFAVVKAGIVPRHLIQFIAAVWAVGIILVSIAGLVLIRGCGA